MGWKDVLRITPTAQRLDLMRCQSSAAPDRDKIGFQAKASPRTLDRKYGKPENVLGSGAGGSILLVTRQSDRAVFAVKKFRKECALDDRREYIRKIVSEYYIGSSLHHGNIIKIYDLFEEQGQWYEVMEYAPYCLFDCVQSGKMSIEEINCSFLQILAGVNHLHRSGFAHRDLKLENIVVTEKGIMKVIDFGSATLCRNLKTDHVVLATGFVGSIPYMAPETLRDRQYDAEKADVWSLAILYCSMILGKFPWKVADHTSKAFELFSSPQHSKTRNGVLSELLHSPTSKTWLTTPGDFPLGNVDSITMINASFSKSGDEKQIKEHVMGPWGLLLCLPSGSRDVIGRMLTITARLRCTLDTVSITQWVQESQVCSQNSSGIIHCGQGHEHALR